MPNLNAALGCSQIDKVKSIIKKHREIFQIYKLKFKEIKFGKIFQEPSYSKSNYWLQTFILSNDDIKLRDKILDYSNKNGIYTRPAWKLMSEIDHLRKFPKMNLSNSKELINKIINIPSSFNF
jgi:perosamine synthetase